MPRRFVVHTMYVVTYICVVYSNWQLRLSIFIHVDNLALINDFVVVAILSEWWSVLTIADHCGHIPEYMKLNNTRNLNIQKLLCV